MLMLMLWLRLLTISQSIFGRRVEYFGGEGSAEKSLQARLGWPDSAQVPPAGKFPRRQRREKEKTREAGRGGGPGARPARGCLSGQLWTGMSGDATCPAPFGLIEIVEEFFFSQASFLLAASFCPRGKVATCLQQTHRLWLRRGVEGVCRLGSGGTGQI